MVDPSLKHRTDLPGDKLMMSEQLSFAPVPKGQSSCVQSRVQSRCNVSLGEIAISVQAFTVLQSMPERTHPSGGCGGHGWKCKSI